jgi:cobalt/nickel transport system permease protein
VLHLDEAAWGSTWRTRHPAEKAALTAGLLLAVLLLPTWPTGALVLLVVAGALRAAGVPWPVFARAARTPAAFAALGALPVAVTLHLSGGVGVSVSPASAALALDLLVRACAGSAAVLLFAATTPLSDALPRLRHLRVPDAVVDVAALTYRMLFTLLGSVRTVREAQAARLGYAGVRASYRSAAALTAATLVRSLDRARRLDDGLAGRGHEGAMRVLVEDRPVSPAFLTAVGGLVAGVLAAGAFAGTSAGRLVVGA